MKYQAKDYLEEFITMTGSTEAKVAERISQVFPITSSAVGHWRTGRNRPKASRLDWIAKRLKRKDVPISLLCELMRDSLNGNGKQ